jgi:hypothetical protein
MKKTFYPIPTSSVISVVHAGWRFVVLLCVLGLGLVGTANATHFRYGSLTWRNVRNDATNRVVEFKVSQSYKRSYTGFPSNAANSMVVGSVVKGADRLYYGDGSFDAIDLIVTSVDIAADNFYGEATLTHTYVSASSYKAYFTSSARLATLANNANGTWYVESLVGVGSGNSSPVSSLPPVVNLAKGQTAATFQLSANDPDGNPLAYSVATRADVNNNTAFNNAPGLAVNATTGAVTFSTATATEGTLYNAVIKVSDGKTSILVDFLIQITKTSVPPAFDYSRTPSNGHVYALSPGQPLTFSVRATDSDAGDIVRLQGIGLPPGASMAPALPTTGNPVASTFSWTPSLSTLGTSVISFVAQDLAGVQTITSITIQVSTRPVFDVPPTASNGSVFQVTPGTLISQTIQASNPDVTNLVRIVSATGLPAGATFSPALPSATAANPVRTQLNWTPGLADWGPHTATFTARNSYNDETTHRLQFIVNSAPSFTSVPGAASLSVVAGHPFSYNITTTDPDLPYGDAVEVEDDVLPAWLTLTDNGNGTATLSGTPAVADAGSNPVSLVAADIFHHGTSYGLITQDFDITVIPCTAQALAHDVALTLDANGQATATAAQVDNGSTATCGIASLALSQTTFDCSNIGANPVTLTLTDAYGNVSTATATVTVADDLLPTLAAPASVSVSTDAGQCSATGVALGTAVATDNCSATVTNDAPATFAKGNTTVTWKATDASGNIATATQTVTVNDTEQPTIAAPANLIVSADAGQCAATGLTLGTASAGDNCTGVVVTNDAPASFPKGITTVTWTATDAAGNVATATQTITVNDTEAPTISAPANVSRSADRGQCSAGSVALGNAVAGDNCTGVTVTNNAPATFSKGTTTVTWTATDAAGLTATATQLVTILDVENPTISAPAAVVVSTNPGQCSATGVTLGRATAADNCSGVTVTNNAPATFAKGPTTVTWTATDASGNVATATQTVTVNDTEAPVLTVPAAIVRSAPASQCGAVVTFTPTATDNCAGATVVASPASGSTFAVGTTTVRLTATDASGNTSTGSFSVTVNDVTAPTVAVRNVTVTLVNGAASVTATDVNNGSTDACGIAMLVLNKASFSCSNLGNNAVTLTVTDIHGNVASMPAVVTVVGSIPAPAVAVAPASSVYTGGVANNLYLGYGSQSATLTATGGVSYAWSPAAGLSSTKVANPVFTATTAGTFAYTVTATNQYGCTATATVTLRIADARCDKDKVVVCHNGHEICISPNAVPAHLTGHAGDQLGACTTAARGLAPAVAAASSSINELSAYPNPANDQATVSFRTPLDGKASVVVYDGMGRRVASLYDGAVNGGQLYSLTLNSQNLATGLYQCQLVVNGKAEMLRLLIAR